MRKAGKPKRKDKNMADTYISFYLRNNRIHIFVDALRGIGSPKYVCFLIADDGKTLILAPYKKKDFHSHRVPQDVYRGKKSMEVSSLQLCRIMAEMQCWNTSCSYRVPGVILPQQKICVYHLDQAERIRPMWVQKNDYFASQFARYHTGLQKAVDSTKL